jgi:hypothetical protein
LDFLVKKCDLVVTHTVRASLRLKVQNRAPRPFFTVDELNELEKEIGIGIFDKKRR